MSKHVIFLGAGASLRSGYPLANGLRLLISSGVKWEEQILEYEKKRSRVGHPIRNPALEYRKAHADTLDLFRYGGFGTLDEFCKLASGSEFQNEINGLRCMVRAALGLFNPEEHFEKSEYYGFVQSLFKSDLFSLRDDVAVLSYNYDPYLEYLLYRALETRRRVRRKGRGGVVLAGPDFEEHISHEQRLNSVTSGFNAMKDLGWLGDEKAQPSFCVLQLHGSIAFVTDEIASFDLLFSKPIEERVTSLFQEKAHNVLPPVLFPWEVMDENGFVEQKSFPWRNARELYSLFVGVWKRARREVQAADKISFVGLSMHDFLLDGLRYLFKDKQGAAEIVIANPDNEPFIGGTGHNHWSRYAHCSASAVSAALNSVAPNMRRLGTVAGRSSQGEGDITLVKDFSEFVRTQMKPVT